MAGWKWLDRVWVLPLHCSSRSWSFLVISHFPLPPASCAAHLCWFLKKINKNCASVSIRIPANPSSENNTGGKKIGKDYSLSHYSRLSFSSGIPYSLFVHTLYVTCQFHQFLSFCCKISFKKKNPILFRVSWCFSCLQKKRLNCWISEAVGHCWLFYLVFYWLSWATYTSHTLNTLYREGLTTKCMHLTCCSQRDFTSAASLFPVFVLR